MFGYPGRADHSSVLNDGPVIEKHIGHGKIFDVHVHTGDQHNLDRYFWVVLKLKGIPARLAD